MVNKEINGKTYLFIKAHADDSFKQKSGEEMYFNQSRWKIIGKASELTEEEWQGVVKELPVGKRWENKGDYPIWFHSAKESGLSIIKSEGLKPETTLIIQKQ